MDRQITSTAGCAVAWTDGAVGVAGEVDRANVHLVEHRIRAGIGDWAGGERVIDTVPTGEAATVLDCTAVTFLDAAGVRMLARLGAAALAAGAVLTVLASPAVLLTVRLCGEPDLPGLVLRGDTVPRTSGDSR